MNTRKLLLCTLAATVAALFLVPFAHAQATRTWVSGVGDDVNPCSRTAPCKTFAGAISKTQVRGTINVLDPGGFGMINITKSITLTGPPGMTTILASSTNGVIVNAPGANVTLRNLEIFGPGLVSGQNPVVGSNTGLHGIKIDAAKSVHVENVSIASFIYTGIRARGVANVFVKNSDIYDVGTGINADRTTAPALNLTVSNSTIQDNTNGVVVSGAQARATLRGCTISGMENIGVHAFTNSRVSLESCSVDSGAYGLYADTGAIMRVSNSTIVGNATAGVTAVGGGSVLSRGNNTLEDNGSGNTFTGLYGPK